MARRSSNRVLVIGLDGATWDLLDTWASDGLLPNIERLRRGGTWGPLRTTIPPVTPSCWNSMYTGTNPGKHGIFGFSKRQKDGYRLSPVHASALRAKTVFQLLNEAGLVIGVLNAPATYPPEPVNGIFVPGIPVPEDVPDYTQPPGFAADLEAVTGGKHRYPPPEAAGHEDEFLSECDEYIRAVKAAAVFMMKRLESWGFFMVEFQVTDSVQHSFWHYVDTGHPRHDPAPPERFRNAVLDRYRLVDESLGEILSTAGDETNVLVVSDHGAGPMYGQLYLNIWLWRRGWLKFKRNPATLLKRLLFGLGVTPEFIRRQVYSRAPRLARKSIEARRLSVLALADHFFLSLDDVDWGRTRAYSFGGPLGAIYVNRQGREPAGNVSEQEYESVLGQLERDLREMRHPRTGETLVENVLRSSDLYDGPFSKEAPDLQLMTRSFGYSAMGFLQFQSKRWIGPPWNRWSGHHSLDGMMMMSGPHVRCGTRVEGARIVDVAPTILALLEQPIPNWMDGTVLTDSLTDEFLERNPPQVRHMDITPSHGTTSTGYSAEDEAAIAKRLADLGYIE